MKITIDTTRKTIEIEEPVNYEELKTELEKLLSDKVGEYTIGIFKPLCPINIVPWFQPSPWTMPNFNPDPPYKITC